MLSRIEGFCRKNELFAEGDAVLVACSGGPDSLALLHVLLGLREKCRLALSALHVEHGIRGQASKDDAAFVEGFCARHGIPLYRESVDAPGWARERKLSLETAARELRHGFFRRMSQKLHARVATAHHADDQAETVLMHILRGTGLSGLCGMRPRDGHLIRPFLCVSRAEIETYCRENRLSPRHDATNDIADGMRNRLRLELLPMLKRDYCPEIAHGLCQLARIAAEETGFLDQQAEAVAKGIVQREKHALSLSLPAFREQHTAIQRRLLLQMVAELSGNREGIGFSHVEALRHLAETGQTGKRLSLPKGIRAEISYGQLRLLRAQETGSAKNGKLLPTPLPVPGRIRLEGLGMSLEAELLEQYAGKKAKNEAVFDWEKIVCPLSVRSRRPGDRIAIEGGRKKLKDLFIDRKLPQAHRDSIPLVCAGERILWAAGIRQADEARVWPGTKRFLRLRIKEFST